MPNWFHCERLCNFISHRSRGMSQSVLITTEDVNNQLTVQKRNKKVSFNWTASHGISRRRLREALRSICDLARWLCAISLDDWAKSELMVCGLESFINNTFNFIIDEFKLMNFLVWVIIDLIAFPAIIKVHLKHSTADLSCLCKNRCSAVKRARSTNHIFPAAHKSTAPGMPTRARVIR